MTSSATGAAARVVIALTLVALLLTAAMWAIGATTRSITTQQQAFPTTGIDTLRIDGGAGPVAIVVVDRWDVVVTTRLTDSALGRIDSRPAISGRTLRITTDCPWRCLMSDAMADHQIAIPRGAIETLELELATGDVRVDGFAGEIEVATTDGDIFLSHFNGEVTRLRTTRGVITVETGDAEPRQIPGRVYASARSRRRSQGTDVDAGTLLRERRRAHGLSQHELAIRTGTRQAMISRIENGHEVPTVQRLEQLLTALGERLELRAVPLDAARVFATLDRHGVDYRTIGASAVSAHGYVRATADIDLVARQDRRPAGSSRRDKRRRRRRACRGPGRPHPHGTSIRTSPRPPRHRGPVTTRGHQRPAIPTPL